MISLRALRLCGKNNIIENKICDYLWNQREINVPHLRRSKQCVDSNFYKDFTPTALMKQMLCGKKLFHRKQNMRLFVKSAGNKYVTPTAL